MYNRLTIHWHRVVLLAAVAGALGLLWLVRDVPLAPLPFVRIDGLSAFFLFAVAGGLALHSFAIPAPPRVPRRTVALAACTLLALSTTLLPLIALAFALIALLTLRGAVPGLRPFRAGRILPLARALLDRTPLLVAAALLLIGYAALVIRGAPTYDDRLTGAALDGFVFWCVLLAAIVPQSVLAAPAGNPAVPLVWRIIWYYSLVRLYSLGPWNTGWSFAALLLGGAVALWAATSALLESRAEVSAQRVPLSYAALALAGFGLSTSAGIAAGCFAVLACIVVQQHAQVTSDEVRVASDELRVTSDELRVASDEVRDLDQDKALDEHQSASTHPVPDTPHLIPWLLSGAVPLTLPFVAGWMAVGAAMAGAVAVLAVVAWLVVLLNALTVALRAPAFPAGNARAASSVALGVFAPLVVLVTVEPAIRQLQGGLTLYGDVNIWPWVGLAARNSASAQVTALPSVAVAALMLVLAALVYLVTRLRGAPAELVTETATTPDPAPPTASTTRVATILALLRDEVAWLGTPANKRERKQHTDAE